MLRDWSSSYIPDKPIRKKITSVKQFQDNVKPMEEEGLSDYVPYSPEPVPSFELPKEMLKQEPELMDKINYMIRLLEEQKDGRTGQSMEELVLYGFLGVFVLFVLDSFVKTGKYYR